VPPPVRHNPTGEAMLKINDRKYYNAAALAAFDIAQVAQR
jgi:hypothetical protein